MLTLRHLLFKLGWAGIRKDHMYHFPMPFWKQFEKVGPRPLEYSMFFADVWSWGVRYTCLETPLVMQRWWVCFYLCIIDYVFFFIILLVAVAVVVAVAVAVIVLLLFFFFLLFFLLLWSLMLLLFCFKPRPFGMNFFKSRFEGGDPKSCVCDLSNHHKDPKQVHLHPSFSEANVGNAIDGTEIRGENQVRLVVYPILSRYLQGFIHPRWLFGISSINSIYIHFSLNVAVFQLMYCRQIFHMSMEFAGSLNHTIGNI